MIHDRVRGPMDRTIARLLGPRDVDREDLVQLAFIELVTTVDKFRGECSLDSWASMLAARVVYKHIRRRQVERRIFGDTDLDAAPRGGTTKDPRYTAEARELLERLRRHLDHLEPDKAWTLVLHDVCGYDLREISDITGASVSAAQTRLTRGRRELHERIAEDVELAGWLESMEGG
jgi:RNA polymerase sigma-70 factor (ECF subfamily)